MMAREYLIAGERGVPDVSEAKDRRTLERCLPHRGRRSALECVVDACLPIRGPGLTPNRLHAVSRHTS